MVLAPQGYPIGSPATGSRMPYQMAMVSGNWCRTASRADPMLGMATCPAPGVLGLWPFPARPRMRSRSCAAHSVITIPCNQIYKNLSRKEPWTLRAPPRRGDSSQAAGACHQDTFCMEADARWQTRASIARGIGSCGMPVLSIDANGPVYWGSHMLRGREIG